MNTYASIAVALAAALSLASCSASEQAPQPRPQDYLVDNTRAMFDTDSNQINCHGGGLLTVDSVTYWYGEMRPTKGFVSESVSCYSTTDFKNWKNEGVMIKAQGTDGPFAEGCIIERPKVVYNAATGKYVMWFHHELPGRGYEAAHAAVAVSDSPTGPFTFVRSGRVNPGAYPLNMTEQQRKTAYDIDSYEWWTPQWRQAVDDGMLCLRDVPGGQMSRDMTVFVDDDGKAYHIYSAEENLTLNIAELTDDYQGHTGRYIRISPAGHNEAPTVLKHGGKYWMVTSGCTGWDPNQARLLVADSIMGQWTQLDVNPCVGEGADKTFGSQGTWIGQAPDGRYYFLSDQWRPRCLADSRSFWLPISFTDDGQPRISWVDKF